VLVAARRLISTAETVPPAAREYFVGVSATDLDDSFHAVLEALTDFEEVAVDVPLRSMAKHLYGACGHVATAAHTTGLPRTREGMETAIDELAAARAEFEAYFPPA